MLFIGKAAQILYYVKNIIQVETQNAFSVQGYLDPEYFLTHKLTDKSDVYSIGVVYLELLTGMHPILNGKNIVREVVPRNFFPSKFEFENL